MGRGRLAAGAVALLLCAQYLVAEAMTASAWQTPYSYSRNYISDLSVTLCVPRGPCSPWGVVMNTGFVLSGLLAVLAAILLAPLVRQAAWRRTLTILAIVHGAGSMIVGFVHSAPATPAGTPRLHLLGAYAAIIGGNLALLAVAAGLKQRWVSTGFRRCSALFGACGLASGLALVVTRGLPPGLLERGAVDTITVWEVTAGALLAAALIRSRLAARRTTVGDAGLGSGVPP